MLYDKCLAAAIVINIAILLIIIQHFHPIIQSLPFWRLQEMRSRAQDLGMGGFYGNNRKRSRTRNSVVDCSSIVQTRHLIVEQGPALQHTM